MCNVFFTDRDSCTRPISTNLRFIKVGEYGLTCGTRFVARGIEVVAIAGFYGFRGVG